MIDPVGHVVAPAASIARMARPVRFARWGIVVLAACHAKGAVPTVVAKEAPAPPSSPPPGPPPPSVPDALPVLVAKVGAALTSGKVGDARALIAERAGECVIEIGATQRRDGGFVLHGGRITARLDPSGVLETYRLEPGCVDLADEQITITHVPSEAGPTYALHGAIEDSATFTADSIAIQDSPEWVAVTATNGEYLAWPRGAATALHGSPPDEGGRAPRVAGRYLVTFAATAITLHRTDGTGVAVRGCTGPVIAAAAVSGGVALQIGTGADTTLCMVSDSGATRRVTPLGHAICGLRRPEPCGWELSATSPQALVFSGLRGGVVIIDPNTGAKLAYRGEPASVFPPTYARCGDTVCVTTIASEDRSEVGRLERVGAAARYLRLAPGASPAADAAMALRSSWCSEGDLLVPCAP